MKVIVSQYGARRRYMIPQILEKAGVLEALYTNSNCQSDLGKISRASKIIKYFFPSLTRLAKRQPNLPSNKIYSFDGLLLKIAMCRFKKDPIATQVETIFEGSSSKFIKWGTKDADWLYTMFIENIEFTRFAKQNGLKIITDIYEDPFIWDELLEEINLPAYSAIQNQKSFYEAQSRLRHKYIDILLEIADQYIVPSEYVKKCIEKSRSFNLDKLNIIPYSSTINNSNYNNEPIKGRIIWVGNDPVRKGLVYCAEAANKLKEKFPFLDFRIIGIMPEGLSMSELFSNLNFVGYCDKNQLSEEYRKADAFVFPTLAEGFAGGLLEAASFGVPIITTYASGLDSDSPGIFIKKRNVDCIVQSISKLIEDRRYRNFISHAIFDYAQNRKDDFAEQLINILYTK